MTHMNMYYQRRVKGSGAQAFAEAVGQAIQQSLAALNAWEKQELAGNPQLYSGAQAVLRPISRMAQFAASMQTGGRDFGLSQPSGMMRWERNMREQLAGMVKELEVIHRNHDARFERDIRWVFRPTRRDIQRLASEIRNTQARFAGN